MNEDIKASLVLGIETSCDETSVAIVDDSKNILAHKTLSQIDLHQIYGGVVPEIAARSHLEVIDGLIIAALSQANLTLKAIDGFAATSGPGLIGGVIVGMTCAKALAAIFNKPFLAINHLEAHALTARLCDEVKFPFLLLLVSGGHCQILLAKGVGNYEKIGETIDDAVGETFDKVAQMLGLPYPGGPEIEKLAKNGDAMRFRLTKPLIDSKNHDHLCNFSFSGLKTAARRLIEQISSFNLESEDSSQIYGQQKHRDLSAISKISSKDKADICASLQKTIGEIITNRLENSILTRESVKNWLSFSSKNSSDLLQESPQTLEPEENFNSKTLVICGGVAANRYLFNEIKTWGQKHEIEVISPPVNLCTDNAAMVAWAGVEKLKLGLIDNFNFKPRARWDL